MTQINSVRVIVDGDIVFEGNIRQVGGGGTKTAFALEGTYFVVLLPNAIDGQWLVNQFDRICEEEVYMYNYLTGHNLLGLPVTQCTVQYIVEGNNVMSTTGLYAPLFASFVQQQAHVVDKKNMYTCTWQPRVTSSNWRPVFEPLLQDLVKLVQSNVIPAGDSYNFLIAEPGSCYYVGTGEFAVRYFGFDFASKRVCLRRPDGAPLECDKKLLLQDALEEAVDYVLGASLDVSTKQLEDIQSCFRRDKDWWASVDHLL